MISREQIAQMIYPEFKERQESLIKLNAQLASENAEMKQDLLENEPILPDPIVGASISSKDLRHVLNETVDKVYILDRTFIIPNINSWEAFLEADTTDEQNYMSDWNDCDNFGVELAVAAKNWMPGCACGVVMDDSHAWFFIVLQKDGEYVLTHVEPQTDGKVKEKHLDGDLYMAWVW